MSTAPLTAAPSSTAAEHDAGDDEEVTLQTLDAKISMLTDLVREIDSHVGNTTKAVEDLIQTQQAMEANIATNNALHPGLGPQPVPAVPKAKKDFMNSIMTMKIPTGSAVYRIPTKEGGKPTIDFRHIAIIFAIIMKMESETKWAIDALTLVFRDSFIGFATSLTPKDDEWNAIPNGFRHAIESSIAGLKDCGKTITAMKNIPPALFTLGAAPKEVKDVITRIGDILKKVIAADKFPHQQDWLASTFQAYSSVLRVPYAKKDTTTAKSTRSSDTNTIEFLESALGVAWVMRLPLELQKEYPIPSYQEGLTPIIPFENVPVATAPAPAR